MTLTDAEREWGKQQVEEYTKLHPRYQTYAKILKEILGYATNKHALLGKVEARPKSISSFAEKIWRKRSEAPDPLHDFTDLCGGRVIATTQDEVKAISKFIEDHFEIDWVNSVDVTQRLKPSEFGYRSVHYIVKVKEEIYPDKIPVSIPKEIIGLKAEIQVRTILEHVWADFNHRMVYKKGYRLPVIWQRKFAKLAALLEESDSLLMEIQEGVGHYLKSFGAYMNREEILREIDTLTQVLGFDPENVDLADQIARMAISIGEWKVAADTLTPLETKRYPPLMRDLGIALINLYEPEDEEYQKGQQYLAEAANQMKNDPEILTSLASSWIPVDEEKAQKTFQGAFERDPFNAYGLSYYIAYQIVEHDNLSLIPAMKPTMNAAIMQCDDFAYVGVGLPWVHYDAAFLQLLLGKDRECLIALAKALQCTPDGWMVGKSLALFQKIKSVRKQFSGYECAYRLHLLGHASLFSDSDAMKSVKGLARATFSTDDPIIILAGGCGKEFQHLMDKYERMMIAAFTDYHGIIISGGTIAGIGGIAGSIQERYPDTITTIGYIPHCIDATSIIDRRFSECRETEGTGFSPLETIQYWTDIIASGIRPENVRLIGINGGEISAVEYRIALALGAKVGIVQESGRQIATLLKDETWNTLPNLIVLPKDPATIRAFVRQGGNGLDPSIRDIIAKKIHEEYRCNQISDVQKKIPNIMEWGELSEEFKESNRLQADDIMVKLKGIGYAMRKAKGKKIRMITFSPEEVEILAELEHGRWNAERLLNGWKWGTTKDIGRKISPYLVPWVALPEDIKEWDRATVRKIPEFLAGVGVEVYREI